jgi:ankyrin repeat protein
MKLIKFSYLLFLLSHPSITPSKKITFMDASLYFNDWFYKKLKNNSLTHEDVNRVIHVNIDSKVFDGIQTSVDMHLTPLHLAAMHNLEKEAWALIKNGADINAQAIKEKKDNGDGEWATIDKELLGTPMDWAKKYNSSGIALLLEVKW